MKTLCNKEAYFILNSLAWFELLKDFQSEIFCTAKHILNFQMGNFFTETFVLNLCNFDVAEVSILLELRFKRNVNIYRVSSFKDFGNVIFASKSFFW